MAHGGGNSCTYLCGGLAAGGGCARRWLREMRKFKFSDSGRTSWILPHVMTLANFIPNIPGPVAGLKNLPQDFE